MSFPYKHNRRISQKIWPVGVHVFTMLCRCINWENMLHTHAVSNHGTMVRWEKARHLSGCQILEYPLNSPSLHGKEKKNNFNNNLNVKKIFCFSTRLEFLFENITNIIYVNGIYSVILHTEWWRCITVIIFLLLAFSFKYHEIQDIFIPVNLAQ